MYDKLHRVAKILPVDVVAQEQKYYPDDVEKALSDAVESPGNKVIAKLLAQTRLTVEERLDLTRYVVIMLTRGPRNRRKTFAMAAQLLPEYFEEIQSALAWLEQFDRSDIDPFIKKQFETMEQSWTLAYPPALLEFLKTPHISAILVKAINEMSWEILPTASGHYFVTSDTPAHYFEGIGLASRDAEFVFTLSKDFALLGHRRGRLTSLRFHSRSRNAIAKEVNRRIISTTERFVFSHRFDDWIDVVSQKSNHLSSILW